MTTARWRLWLAIPLWSGLGCGGPEPQPDTPVDPWADAFAPFRDCTMVESWYPLGGNDVGYRFEWTFDATGRWVRVDWFDVWYQDGDLGSTSTREVDALGRTLLYEHDSAPFGEVDVAVDITWDGFRWTQAEQRSDSGAAPAGVWTAVFDHLDRPVREEFDELPSDGVPDEVAVRTYGDSSLGAGTHGDLWRSASTTVVDGSGALIQKFDQTFDAQGRQATTFDHTDTGSREWFETCTFEYDEVGRIARSDCACDPECVSRWASRTKIYEWACPD